MLDKITSSTDSRHKEDYRPDIDGLRAVAVLSVALYHLNIIHHLTGGFLGVDIFFVISGYLITRNIVADLKSGQFTIGRFYLKRVRRIAPALLATVFLCLFVSTIVSSPLELEKLAQSAIAAVLSVSNILFWTQSGYFETTAWTKPLLHTWSLGVEEQFYFVWPLALSLLWRRRPVWLAIFVGAVFLLSLAAAQWTVASDQNLAFYLSPFRAFEFAVGASVLWAPQLKRQLARELGLAVGLILIVYSLFAYTAQSPMPGFETLVPTVGAALVIYCGEARLGILLRNWPARWIGRISYSLYLVHWPILVFAQYILMRDLTRLEAVLAFFVSVAVAWLMLVFVETPFRQRDGRAFRISSRRLLAATGTVAILLICVGTTAAFSGWPWRLGDRGPLANLPGASNFQARYYGGVGCKEPYCETSPGAQRKIYVIGDSHAYAYFQGLKHQFPNIDFIFHVASACEFFSPDFNASGASNPRLCAQARQAAFEAIAAHPSDVILVQEWSIYVRRPYTSASSDRPAAADLAAYASFVTQQIGLIQNMIGPDHRVLVLGDVPRFKLGTTPLDCVTRPFTAGCETSSLSNSFNGYPVDVNKAIAKDLHGIPYVDASSYLCHDGTCANFNDGKPLYSDATHLSIWGSDLLAKEMWPAVLDKLEAG